MTIELYGLELFGHHGVLESEKENGQRFLYDLWLDVGERGRSDRIEEAVDYREVVEAVREVHDTPHELLESLAADVADALLERFGLDRVRVRVRKPDVALPVEFPAVSVERP
ncbi:MAG TPA: dihydroneopterin aldolase [Gaiellaceae bacterium]